MTENQLLALEMHLPRIEAEEVLKRASYGEINLNRNGWYEFTIQATGDKDEAEEAANEYSRQRMRQGLDPE